MAVRGQVVEDLGVQRIRTGYGLGGMLRLYGIPRSTYYSWFDSSGALKPPEGKRVRCLTEITPEEIEAVVAYRKRHSEVGYRKLCWMMVDENVACLSEASVYTILSARGLLYGWARPEAEGAGKEYRHKPKHPHHHWHTDIAYLKIRNVFYFLIMVLDGYSRFLLDWDLMTDMAGSSVELFLQRAKEKYPHAHPMLIHDNGSQFVSHDFKRLVTTLKIQSVPTRRNHPETNGKAERWNKSVKHEAIRPNCPASYGEAWEILNEYAYAYNYQRLHAGIDYLRPSDLFFGRKETVLKERNEKLKQARQRRIEINRKRKTTA